MKKIYMFIAITSLILIMSLCPLHASAETFSGKCGGGCTWTLDTETGEMRISGRGKMNDYLSVPDTPWTSHRDKITSLVIEEGITGIGDNCFGGFQKIPEIRLPSSVAEIGNYAFLDCQGIKKLIIPESVKYIGSGAFYGCTNLAEVNLADSITVIRESTFEMCVNLSSITFPDSVKEIGARAFTRCHNLKSVSFGGGVERIGDYCFEMCDSLEEIIIPDQVTSMGVSVFYMCPKLSKAVLGSGLETVSRNLFTSSGLNKVVISEGTVVIDDYAFANCYRLTDIVFPKSLKSINFGAFINCIRTMRVKYLGCEEQWKKVNVVITEGNERVTFDKVKPLPHEMTELKPYNAEFHQYACVCDDAEYEPHEFNEILLYDDLQHAYTCKCGEIMYEEHIYNDDICISCEQTKPTRGITIVVFCVMCLVFAILIAVSVICKKVFSRNKGVCASVRRDF